MPSGLFQRKEDILSFPLTSLHQTVLCLPHQPPPGHTSCAHSKEQAVLQTPITSVHFHTPGLTVSLTG